MTLFTLAAALISASHVCCVALLSAYQQTTSAALHNRSFEGFLSLGKKEIEWGHQQQKERQNQRGEHTPIRKHTNTYNVCCKPTQMDMIAGLFSLYLFTLRCSSAFLSLGLIRLLVEMEAIGEDSWANDETLCYNCTDKEVVLLAAKKRKKMELHNKGPEALLCADGLAAVKRTPFCRARLL